MTEKNITTNQLAKIIKKSFDSVDKKIDEKFSQVATKEQVRGLDTKMTAVEKKLSKVEESLGEVRTVLTDAHVL